MLRILRRIAMLVGAVSPMLFAGTAVQAKPTPAEALGITPTQQDVDYDLPTKGEVAKCTLDVDSFGGISGFVVKSASGEILRRFLDTNGDNQVDQWCYFKDGIEIYRDIDTDHNNKVNECRWLGTAGTRWGIDKDQDGKIDSWKSISPEEVTSELVAAIGSADAARFRRLLLTSSELDSLGLADKKTAEIKARIDASLKNFADRCEAQKLISAKSEWIHFGASRPAVIPAGTDGNTKDLTIYDDASAVVETPTGKEKKHSQLMIGSMVKVGDGWRVLGLPENIELTKTASFRLLAPSNAAGGSGEPVAGTGDLSPESRKLYDELETLEKSLASATPEKQTEIHDKRADILSKLIKSANSAEERGNWVRQFAETISAAVTAGNYPDGVERLEKLAEETVALPGSKQLLPFVKYRLLQAQKDSASQKEDADYAKINETWTAGLETIIEDYPAAPEAAEAMLQLGMAHEFNEKPKEALTWYNRLLAEMPSSDQAKKATGAKTRLDSTGKKIALKGKSIDGRAAVNLADYTGKVVLIHYWATWAGPSKEDMDVIKDMQAKYGKSGFQPLGVNLDGSATDAKTFLAANRYPWPHAFEEGGIEESRLASEMGILTLPMMMLVDKQGRVLNNNVHAAELDAELKKALGLNTSSTGSKGKTR
ncbi:MAG: TlpA family protein disulfide reductase [Pirellulaceae bacterium]|nr:TlpA family protein disulfide reductase [Pirellulaceae bacterium]